MPVLTVTLHGGPNDGERRELSGDLAANPPALMGYHGEAAAPGRYELRSLSGPTPEYHWVELRSAAPDTPSLADALRTSLQPEGPRVLTVHQPWAHAIIHGVPPKDVENRSWKTTYRGRMYIHASMTDDEKAPGAAWASGGAYHQHVHGAIIGYVTLTDVTLAGEIDDVVSPWAEPDAWHWQLRDNVALPWPLQIHGRQNLWRPPAWVVMAIAELELEP